MLIISLPSSLTATKPSSGRGACDCPGASVSGGHRARILKDAPILVLDEPTSSVDVDTESAIIEAMDHLMEGRTTLMIAHRLSTLDRCDIRLEVNNGHVTEANLHKLLLLPHRQPDD